ncbi:lytic transglycosylase domain-containing protein [Sphingobium sp.]|uniref:lytic transglycosylase domain-containing protein n=1 Tax=Sphingobium sp. TaxID=1912891 RepID=UPI0028BDC441|nr:lytic transglycosylase domain-containing protein [Sphingobium sp.]
MRKALLLAGMMFVGIDAADASPPRTVRIAQMITMGGDPSADRQNDLNPTAGVVVQQFGGQPSTFADSPDRHSVESEMASSFVEQGPAQVDSWSVFDPGDRGDVSRFTDALAIPRWMTGAPLYPATASRWTPACLPVAYRPTGFLKADAESRRLGYYGLMSQIACEFGIPVGLFDAMIIQESRYRHHVFSSKSAYGLTQLMPDTATEMGVDRYAVDQNLRGGAHYLRQQLDRFGQVHLALAAYNAGPGRVRNATIPRIRETRLYVDTILRNWSRLSGSAMPSWPLEGSPPSGDRRDQTPYRTVLVSTFRERIRSADR